MIMNRALLKDVSIEEMLKDIAQTSREDMIVGINKIRLVPAGTGETGISAVFEGLLRPVNKNALSQLDSILLTNFASYGKRLRDNNLQELYLENANRLLSLRLEKIMARMSARHSEKMAIRAFLSTSYQRYDDDEVFNTVLDAIADTPAAMNFRILGGYRSDSISYIKLVGEERLFTLSADGRERAFYPAIIISNSETGNGCCRLDTMFIDHYCSNGCIFGVSNLEQIKIVHRGRNLNGFASGSIIAPYQGVESIEKMKSKIRHAVKAAFKKEIYWPYQALLKKAAEIKIDGDEQSLELVVKQIGRRFELTSLENMAIVQRMLSSGDRSLFGIQAALTDEAKYAKNHDRKIQLERIGGKIITEIPPQWKAIQRAAAAERVKYQERSIL